MRVENRGRLELRSLSLRFHARNFAVRRALETPAVFVQLQQSSRESREFTANGDWEESPAGFSLPPRFYN